MYSDITNAFQNASKWKEILLSELEVVNINIFDIVPPEPPKLDAAIPPVTNQEELFITGTKSEATTEIIITGTSAIISITGSTTWEANLSLTEGENLIEFVALDQAGNESESTFFPVVRDTIAPNIDFLNPMDGAIVNSGSIVLEGNIGGIPFSEMKVLDPGVNILSKSKIDEAGNESISSITIDFYKLLAEFKLDGDAKDTMGKFNGLVRGAVPIPGMLNDALLFDGINDYVAIENLSFSTPGAIEEITICSWVKTTASEQKWWENWSILGFDRSEYFTFSIRGDDGRLAFSTVTPSRDVDDLFGKTSVNDGEWHFVCAVFNGSDKILYVNGQEDNRVINPHKGETLGTGITRFGFMGDGSEAISFNGNRNKRYYEGSLDELSIYSQALAPSTISKIYDSYLNSEENFIAKKPLLQGEFPILKATSPPKIDGNLEEYHNASVISFGDANIKMMWNEDSIFLGYKVVDTDLTGMTTTRDDVAVLNEDSCMWFVSTLDEENSESAEPNSLLMGEFKGAVTFSNNQFDEQGSESGIPERTWDGNWSSAVEIQGSPNNAADVDEGFLVEIEIPWTVLGFATAPDAGSIIRIGLATTNTEGSETSFLMWPGLTTSVQNSSNWRPIVLSQESVPKRSGVDLEAPESPIVLEGPEQTNQSQISITGRKSEDTVEIRINGSSSVLQITGPSTWEAKLSLEEEGENVFEIVGLDEAGNQSSPTLFSPVMDTQSPQIIFNHPP